ncbi:MAG: archaeosortase/exosortase family protein, partial [Planctomycetota bacterium]
MTPALAVFAPLVLAYWTALVWCVDRWNAPTEYFAHCWLVPPVAAWLLWSRRAEWSPRPRVVDPKGWLRLAPARRGRPAGAGRGWAAGCAGTVALALRR